MAITHSEWLRLFLVYFAIKIAAANEVCYPQMGCFSTDPPFGISLERPITLLPQDPESIGTVFRLYDKDHVNYSLYLDAMLIDEVKNIWPDFKANLPVKVLIHGFFEKRLLLDWMKKIKTEILKEGDHNVIIVDWSYGNSPPYAQATANTRVVGAQVAYLINTLQETFGVKPSDVHIIGHSLGGHIGGYAGERIKGLGRITGLDPAGPFFQNTDPKVRLDPTDAEFVDVIHTDGSSFILFGFGSLQPMGHSDFYPNKGYDMPGCIPNPIKDIEDFGVYEGFDTFVSCQHQRSILYFTESINSKCPFTAYPCQGEHECSTGNVRSCGTQGCSRMGFHAQPSNGSLNKYYLRTSDKEPFCQYHLEVSIEFSSSQLFTENGNIIVSPTGTLGSTKPVQASSRAVKFTSGQLFHFTVTSSDDIGDMKSVSLTWVADNSLDSFARNTFGNITKNVYINKVTVYSPETDQSVSFCSGDIGIKDKQTFLLSVTC